MAGNIGSFEELVYGLDNGRIFHPRVVAATGAAKAVTFPAAQVMVLTTEALTDAADTDATYVVTQPLATATSVAFAVLVGGTDTEDAIIRKCVCTAGTITITYRSVDADALDGTLIILIYLIP
jgi:hypothetical protein